jgi:ABC-type nitrate/sulfonate/bicarbonate transport system ATPase subunit
MSTPRVELVEVSKTFHGETRNVEALRSISMRLDPGEFVTVIGPSGSGKSTLFNLITGLLEPDEGSIRVDGEARSDRSGAVSYMPQRDLLLPWRSVIDNAIIPLEIQDIARKEARRRARELLPQFGLEQFAESYPSTLSGGMKQRAALLRTVMSGRETLLLDEPFGALDALTRRELQDWLLRLQRELKRTILFITHDIDEAVYLADRVIVLSARPGRVVKTLTVDLPRPRHQRMIADPAFAERVTELINTLGLDASG